MMKRICIGVIFGYLLLAFLSCGGVDLGMKQRRALNSGQWDTVTLSDIFPLFTAWSPDTGEVCYLSSNVLLDSNNTGLYYYVKCIDSVVEGIYLYGRVVAPAETNLKKLSFAFDEKVLDVIPQNVRDRKLDDETYVKEFRCKLFTRNDFEVLRDLMYSKHVEIRAQGDTYHKVWTPSPVQLQNARNVYRLYYAMGGVGH